MVRMPWATYLWPGLPHLWYGGLWSGLALAVGFGALVNALLLATFVWVELVNPQVLRYAWLGTTVLWIGTSAASAWFSWGVIARRLTSAEAMFREALVEYIKGNWFETERILSRLLHVHPCDVEARLMLATLLRHTERYQEALEQLARLELLRESSTWSAEIAAEKGWIADSRAGQKEPDPVTANDIPSPTASPRAA